MRVVVRSKTYTAQLQILLDQGAPKFGMRVVEAKLAELDRTLDVFLGARPDKGPSRLAGLALLANIQLTQPLRAS